MEAAIAWWWSEWVRTGEEELEVTEDLRMALLEWQAEGVPSARALAADYPPSGALASPGDEDHAGHLHI